MARLGLKPRTFGLQCRFSTTELLGRIPVHFSLAFLEISYPKEISQTHRFFVIIVGYLVRHGLLQAKELLS